jgi:hypothetical protein
VCSAATVSRARNSASLSDASSRSDRSIAVPSRLSHSSFFCSASSTVMAAVLLSSSLRRVASRSWRRASTLASFSAMVAR